MQESLIDIRVAAKTHPNMVEITGLHPTTMNTCTPVKNMTCRAYCTQGGSMRLTARVLAMSFKMNNNLTPLLVVIKKKLNLE